MANVKEPDTACGAVDFLNQLRKAQKEEIQDEKKELTILEKSIKNREIEYENNKKGIKHTKEREGIIIREINPSHIVRWSEKDRPENELGDLEDLARSFKEIGQQVPCIVRPYQASKNKYELIVGERRWRAAQLADLPVKAVLEDLTDKEASLIQAIENEKRQDISDYAKGMSYAEKIDKGYLTQRDLINTLNLSKQQVSRLLSFKRVPKPLVDAIKDFRKVSARTSEELCRIANKGDDHLNALIEIADNIRSGKYGANKIDSQVYKRLNNNKKLKVHNKKVNDDLGRHLFTWRQDNNLNPSIHFPKDILKLINEEKIDFDNLTEKFKTCISESISNIIETQPSSPHVGTK